ncbi:MAG: MFS transporter [Acidimicrobiales bacterium]
MIAENMRPEGTRSLVPLLSLTMTAAAITYAVLAVLASAIIDDLNISRAQLGLVVSGYSITAALLSPFVGQLVDTVGARIGMLMVFGFASLGFAAMSLASGFLTLVGAAGIVAVGNSLGNPSTNKMIALEIPDGRRGAVTGIKQSGVQVGSFLGGVSFPVIESIWGWRGVMLGLSGIFVLMGMWAGVALPRGDRPVDSGNHSIASAVERRRLPPAIKWIASYAFLMGAGGSPVFSFLALYAEESLHASATTAGWIIALAGLVGIVSRIGWSISTERHGDFPGSMLAMALIAIVAGVFAIAANSAGLWLLWCAAIVSGASISAWNSVAMLSVISDAGPALAGRASGVVVAGFLGGLAVSPPLFGWSVDRFDTYTPGFIGVLVCFAAAAWVMAAWRRRCQAVFNLAA